VILEAIFGSIVLTAIVFGWVIVQQWTASQTHPEECDLPRSKCHHCIWRAACTLNSEKDIRENSDNHSR